MKHQLRRLQRCLIKQSNIDNLTSQFKNTYRDLKAEYCELKEKDGRKSLSNKEVDNLIVLALHRFFKTMHH